MAASGSALLMSSAAATSSLPSVAVRSPPSRTFVRVCGPSSHPSHGLRSSSRARAPLTPSRSASPSPRKSASARSESSGAPVEAERQKLKHKLYELIDATSGNLTEECTEVILELEKLNPNTAPLQNPQLIGGYWEVVRASLKGTGRKGEAKVGVGYKGSVATLGRITRNAFKPYDLELVMGDVVNYVNVDEGYNEIVVPVTMKNPTSSTEVPEIEGVIVNYLLQELSTPARMNIKMITSTLRPCHPERDLEVWREIFAESAATMDAEGRMVSPFPPGMTGHVDYVYIEEDLRITKGHLGAYVVTRKLAAAPSYLVARGTASPGDT